MKTPLGVEGARLIREEIARDRAIRERRQRAGEDLGLLTIEEQLGGRGVGAPRPSIPPPPTLPENVVGFEPWGRCFPESQFELWQLLPWWFRVRFWPDGSRRALGRVFR